MSNQEKCNNYLEWFENKDFTNLQIQFDQCSKTENAQKVVDGHVPIVRRNWNNRIFKPYLDRLQQIKESYEKI